MESWLVVLLPFILQHLNQDISPHNHLLLLLLLLAIVFLFLIFNL